MQTNSNRGDTETSSENGYYNSDVTMQIHAVDEEENEVASGLVSLEYKMAVCSRAGSRKH